MDQFAKQVVLYTLRAYKWMISPLLPPACRYVPTCSEYAMEAVERYGAVRGSWLALRRLLRCHPFVSGGFDPVVKRVAEPLVKHTVSECKHAVSQTAPDFDVEERRFQTAESATSKPCENGASKSSKRDALKLWKSGALAPRNSAKPLPGFSPRTGLNV